LPWGWRIRSVAGTGAALRDQPASPHFGRSAAFTASGRRRSQIVWRKPTIYEASSVWPAFAVGHVRLAGGSGLTRIDWFNFPGRSALLRSRQERFAEDLLSLSLNEDTPPYDPFGSSIPADPLSLRAFAPDSSGPPQTSGAAEPLLRLGPRSAAGPCGPQRSRRLSVPLQPDSRPGLNPGRRLLSEASAGTLRGGRPAFIG